MHRHRGGSSPIRYQPKSILLIRHGERLDHVDEEFARTNPRPHDGPLTSRGADAAQLLGQKLRRWASVTDPVEEVLILTSPLYRCVETAHNIALGLVQGDEALLRRVKLQVNESLVEGAYWMSKDVYRNEEYVVSRSFPFPVYYSAAEHPARSHGLHLLPVHLTLGCAPSYWLETEQKLRLREELSVGRRCERGANALFRCSAVHGKVVILVGHGETTHLWFNGISSVPTEDHPDYLGVAELVPRTDGRDGSVCWVPTFEPFQCIHTLTDDGMDDK